MSVMKFLFIAFNFFIICLQKQYCCLSPFPVSLGNKYEVAHLKLVIHHQGENQIVFTSEETDIWDLHKSGNGYKKINK